VGHLIVAFSSALQLQNRDAVCSWEDKAACILLAPSMDMVSGDCRDVRAKCCNLLSLGGGGATLPQETRYCECFLKAGGGPTFQCSQSETRCFVFAAFFLVMSVSVVSLLLVHWLSPYLKFAVLPFYCFCINLCYLVPTYLWTTCGDKDLRTQYATTASILGVALLVFIVMLVLMWRLDYNEKSGFSKVMPKANQQAPAAAQHDIEMRHHDISAPFQVTTPSTATRRVVSPRRHPETTLTSPLILHDSDTTSGAISPKGLTRNL
jgi:hypothetical protein